ncbi:MAG: serine/threonine protein kinase, partial [Akkermansiaceae bacterium]
MKYQSVEGALPLGFQLGGYRIERILGDGGFGIAYLATIAEGGIKCAIKEFFPRDHAHRSGDSSVRVANPSMQDDFEYMRAMFAEEGRVLASLSHPSFVRYIDYFDAMGTSYLVMSYESGFDLLHSIKNGRTMSEDDMLNFILPLLGGLETLHAQGYIHRDIKPQNIFSGPDNHAVLIDFGAAILIDTQLSIPPDGIFSEHFAPIEQYENDGGMGPWTDVYAVAAVMFFMLTGNKPPKATDRKLKQVPIVPLATSGIEGYSTATLAAIDQALAQNP